MFWILSFLSPNTKGVVLYFVVWTVGTTTRHTVSLLAVRVGELSQFLLPLDGAGEELRVSQLWPVG